MYGFRTVGAIAKVTAMDSVLTQYVALFCTKVVLMMYKWMQFN
jgi:hypothetical protein